MADNPRPGDRRYTIQTLAAGQPRPYADTIRHVRVTMEWVPWNNSAEGWQPDPANVPEAIHDRLKGLQCGFTAKTAKEVEWYESRLDWLRNPEPGVWEFHITSPYTD